MKSRMGVMVPFNDTFRQQHMGGPMKSTIGRNPQGFPVVVKVEQRIAVQPYVIEWLTERVGARRLRWMLFENNGKIWFLRNSDAVLFKLTWL